MNKNYSFCKMLFASLVMLLICQVSFGQNIQWQKCLGGANSERASCIQSTSDGGYILAGYTYSHDGDVTGNHDLTSNTADVWIVKLDNTGMIQWEKNFGGTNDDKAYSIQLTSDGGYIFTGATYSADGDVIGNHAAFYADVWVVKLDGNGVIQWQKTLGGGFDDYANAILQTSDNGYILTGVAYSNDGDVSGNHGKYDVWVIKLTSAGALEWQKALGGTDNDYAYTIEITSDGGYILAGSTLSNDGDVSGLHGGGNRDVWVVKLTSTGTIQWQKCLGGSAGEDGLSILQTSDGGYIFTGMSGSNDGDGSGHHGYGDVWVVKLTTTGTIQWQKELGGLLFDEGHSIQTTADGGYILTGYTLSSSGDVMGSHGNSETWTIKLTSNGTIQWQKCLGGFSDESFNSIQVTSDGGYILTGYTGSTDGDVTVNHGDLDVWVVKLEGFGVEVADEMNIMDLNISPNPISDNTTLNYHLTQSTPIEIIITDVLGNKILSQTEPTQAAGAHQKTLNLDNVASGTYFLQLKTEYGSRTTQIVKN